MGFGGVIIDVILESSILFSLICVPLLSVWIEDNLALSWRYILKSKLCVRPSSVWIGNNIWIILHDRWLVKMANQ